MTAPLLTRDARDLRLLARPRWQRRVMAWTLPFAAAVLVGLHTDAAGPVTCSAAQPCRPDVVGSVAIGLLVLAAFAGFIYPRLAAWFAGGFLVALVLSERILQASLVSPAWLYLVDLGFVGLCVLLGNVSRDRPPTDRAMQWMAGVRRAQPPAAPAGLPRPGAIWRAVGWALVLPAAACLAWGWYAQERVDAQQEVAARATAEVITHVDEFTLVVRLPGEETTIGVLDAANYPVGSRLDLYVDDQGLRQPVSEPYDASGWLLLAVFLAGLAVATWARGSVAQHRARSLFAEEQPVTEVSILPGLGVIAVYAGDARPGEPALLEIPTNTVLIRGDGEVQITTADLEPGLQPAYLYGTPAPGHWCTVVVQGRSVVPSRALSLREVGAPPYHDDVLAGAVDGPSWSVEADLPLRAEEVEALRPADRNARPDEVRFHVRSQAAGYLRAIGMAAAFALLGRFLPALPFGTALLIAASLLGLACVGSWRLFMRGRMAWNGHGIATIGAFGDRRVPWPLVTDIQADDDSVTVHTGESGHVVGAGPTLWILGRHERTPVELANALRYARNSATPGDEADLPYLDRPRAPLGLYGLWLFGTPALAWLLQVISAG